MEGIGGRANFQEGIKLFLEIEGNVLINVELIDRVELKHAEHQKYAILWVGGVMQGDSHIAYRWFMANSEKVIRLA